jgi:hypothetical protein
MTNEIITLIANVALTLSFIVALVFGIAQVRAAARDRGERLTLDTLRGFQTREFAELMQYITSHDMPLTRKEWQALPPDEQVIYTQFAQEMESLGILVAERLIGLDLVDKTLGSLVATAWGKYRMVIEDSREVIPDPFLCEYFQWLAEQIEKRMREHPRKPFFEAPGRV